MSSTQQPASPGSDGEVDEFVSALLGASWIIVGMSARSIGEVDLTLTVSKFRAMAVLARHGSTNLQRLADELQVNASTAMRSIDKLVDRGFVSRHENPASRREVILALTEAGQEVVRTVMRKRRAEIRQIVMNMPADDRKFLVAALQSFVEAGGGAAPTHGTVGW